MIELGPYTVDSITLGPYQIDSITVGEIDVDMGSPKSSISNGEE